MEFFEFFFSGPGWVFKFIALCLITAIIGDIINNIFDTCFSYIVTKKIIDENKDIITDEKHDKDENRKATIDDVRS